MAVYGPRVVGYLTGIDPVFMRFTAGGTFAKGDFVMIEGTTGEIIAATGGSSILGVARMAGTDGLANVKVDVTPGMKVLMDNDQDSETFDAQDELQYFDIIAGTGAQIVNTDSNSGTKAQLLCLDYNPQGYGCDSDISMGLFLVVERSFAEQASA